MYQLAEVVVGTGTLVISMATSYMDMVIYIVIYGFCDGAFITALNVLILRKIYMLNLSCCCCYKLK